MATQAKAQTQIERAHLQQIERLRYQAALAQRQYNQVDPLCGLHSNVAPRV
jgi:hypothetical protein